MKVYSSMMVGWSSKVTLTLTVSIVMASEPSFVNKLIELLLGSSNENHEKVVT